MGWILVVMMAIAPLSLPSHTLAISIPSTSSHPQTAEILLHEGITHFESDDFSTAIDVWQTALNLSPAPDNDFTRALILSNLSLAHQHLSEWDTAQQRLSESLLIFAAHNDASRSPTEWDYYAKVLNTQGWLHWRQGQAQEALDSWQQANHAYQLANNTSGMIGSQINQAQTLQSLGLSAEAMEQLTTVTALLEQQPDSLLKVTGLHHLGNALRRIGQLEPSATTLEEAIALLDTQSTPTEQTDRHTKLKSALLFRPEQHLSCPMGASH